MLLCYNVVGELIPGIIRRSSVKYQDFSHGEFVLTPKFTGFRKNGDLYEDFTY
jgi:hypothetical protein